MKWFCFIAFTLMVHFPFAQQTNLLGVWKAIDDENKASTSNIELYMKGDKLYGRVIEILPNATLRICKNCPGVKNGKDLVGLDIIWEMSPYKSHWIGGQIVNPKNGKVYSCNIWLKDYHTLEVRGYIGIPLLGRTQTWFRVN
jgi:uncharacterized protein (DUF2147 family)